MESVPMSICAAAIPNRPCRAYQARVSPNESGADLAPLLSGLWGGLPHYSHFRRRRRMATIKATVTPMPQANAMAKVASSFGLLRASELPNNLRSASMP